MNKPIYLIFFLLIVGASPSCTDADEENAHAILGLWYQSSPFHDDPTRFYRNAYHFKPDGTFEYSLKVIERVGERDTELGYKSMHTGNYQLLKNTLILENVRYYGLDGEREMLVRDQLILHHEAHDEMDVRFNKKRDRLTLGKPCPPNAMCLGPQTYEKER